MGKPRRITNMSEILKESEKFKELTQAAPPEEEKHQEQPVVPNTSQEGGSPTVQAAPTTTPTQEYNIPTILQNNNIVKKKRKTDERDAKMYYLDPGQTDKLDDLRREYKIRTGKKLNEQDFMRHIVNRITIDMLV